MITKNKQLMKHFQNNITIYIFMIILFLTGIVFGAIIVNSMSFIQKQDLFFYLERFFGQFDAKLPNHVAIFKSSVFYHAKYLMLLFLLGLSVIGLPVVWILLFLKGLMIGFSVGFIVNQLGVKGLFLAALAIAPQNLLIIPIYIVAGSLSMIFSLKLLSKIFTHKISQSILRPFQRYILIFFLLFAISIFAAVIEAYVSHFAMQSFIKSFFT